MILLKFDTDRVVNELIEDSETGESIQTEKLAETITGCIRETSVDQLETLTGLLNQRALERQDLPYKHPDYRGEGDLYVASIPRP